MALLLKLRLIYEVKGPSLAFGICGNLCSSKDGWGVDYITTNHDDNSITPGKVFKGPKGAPPHLCGKFDELSLDSIGEVYTLTLGGGHS